MTSLNFMIPLNSLAELQAHQRAWAASQHLTPDDSNYMSTVKDNLLYPLSEAARGQFERGRGSELHDGARRPAKMRALHSSSAIVVNFFDYWNTRDKAALSQALSLSPAVDKIEFEYQPPLPTGTQPPNLDVRLVQSNEHSIATEYSIAIESKFTEWTHRKSLRKTSLGKPPISDRYFPAGKEFWSDLGLKACQQLAKRLHDADEEAAPFIYLDVPQLLKHSLGLANRLGSRFDLWYVYYEFSGPQSAVHRAEVEKFSELVGAELRFRALTYQELFSSLSKQASLADADYLSKLNERYKFS